MFEGEDGIYTEKAKEEGAEPVKQEGAFNEANVWARIATVFAGPFFNMILAFLLALIVVGFAGSTKPTVNALMEGYPAAEINMGLSH